MSAIAVLNPQGADVLFKRMHDLAEQGRQEYRLAHPGQQVPPSLATCPAGACSPSWPHPAAAATVPAARPPCLTAVSACGWPGPAHSVMPWTGSVRVTCATSQEEPQAVPAQTAEGAAPSPELFRIRPDGRLVPLSNPLPDNLAPGRQLG